MVTRVTGVDIEQATTRSIDALNRAYGIDGSNLFDIELTTLDGRDFDLTQMKKRVFSFSINMTDKYVNSYFHALHTDSQESKDEIMQWNNKYCFGALDKVNNFLNETEARLFFCQYDVLFSIDIFVLNLPYFDGEFRDYTFRDFISSQIQLGSLNKRLKIIGIGANALGTHTGGSTVQGLEGNILAESQRKRIKGNLTSIFRFFPMNSIYFDEVHIRDAHSTLPNLTLTLPDGGTADAYWLYSWLNSVENKKFFAYVSPQYMSTHTRGIKPPFAATWGCRKMVGDETPLCRYQSTFYESLNVFRNSNGSFFKDDDRLKDPRYGVDEVFLLRYFNHLDEGRLLSATNDQDYREMRYNFYNVGMTLLVYQVLGAKTHESNFLLNNNDETYQEQKNILTWIPYTDTPKVPSGIIKYRDNSFLPPNTVFVETRCILKSIIKSLHREYGREPTIGEYFNSLNPQNMTIFELESIRLLFGREHIWEYIFQNSYLTNENVIFRDYILNWETTIGRGDMTFDSMCNVNINFKGDMMDPITDTFISGGNASIDNMEYILIP